MDDQPLIITDDELRARRPAAGGGRGRRRGRRTPREPESRALWRARPWCSSTRRWSARGGRRRLPRRPGVVVVASAPPRLGALGALRPAGRRSNRSAARIRGDADRTAVRRRRWAARATVGASPCSVPAAAPARRCSPVSIAFAAARERGQPRCCWSTATRGAPDWTCCWASRTNPGLRWGDLAAPIGPAAGRRAAPGPARGHRRVRPGRGALSWPPAGERDQCGRADCRARCRPTDGGRHGHRPAPAARAGRRSGAGAGGSRRPGHARRCPRMLGGGTGLRADPAVRDPGRAGRPRTVARWDGCRRTGRRAGPAAARADAADPLAAARPWRSASRSARIAAGRWPRRRERCCRRRLPREHAA